VVIPISDDDPVRTVYCDVFWRLELTIDTAFRAELTEEVSRCVEYLDAVVRKRISDDDPV
jgi:hypothetical protein